MGARLKADTCRYIEQLVRTPLRELWCSHQTIQDDKSRGGALRHDTGGLRPPVNYWVMICSVRYVFLISSL